jgi:hypothetical protein
MGYKLKWNPSRNNIRSLYYDQYYGAAPQKIMPVLHGSAPMMYGNSAELFAKPLCQTKRNVDDAKTPASYIEYTKWTSLFAARYGGAPVGGFGALTNEINKYVAAPDNTGLGKGFVKHIEIFNETDRAWSDPMTANVTGDALNTDPLQFTKYYFRPIEYAAMLSAVYDGNKSTDPNFDIKDASGNKVGHWGITNFSKGTKVVMAGTADIRNDYLRLLKENWDATRGTGDYPFDIVNLHFYSTSSHPKLDDTNWNYFWNGRNYFDANGSGVFPEADNITIRNRIIKAGISSRSLFNKPLWITEFGYATKFGQGASGVDFTPPAGVSTETVQGQWLSRYIMEVASTKEVDKLFIYELQDYPKTDLPNQFDFTGIRRQNGAPKTSWYHLMTMLNIIGYSKYKSFQLLDGTENAIEPGSPRVYKYVDNGDNNLIRRETFVVWKPTGDGGNGSGELKIRKKIFLNGNQENIKPVVELIRVLEYEEDGKRTILDESNVHDSGDFWIIGEGNEHTLKYNETPMYVRLNPIFPTRETTVLPVLEGSLTVDCHSCTSAKVSWQPSQIYTYYRVYYAKKSEYGMSPSIFDPSKATLYADKVIGVATSVVVSGLIANELYHFWVIPYLRTYPDVIGADFTGDLEEGAHYFTYEVKKCDFTTNCSLPLTGNNITDVTTNASTPQSFVKTNLQAMFNQQATSSDICNELTTLPTYNTNQSLETYPNFNRVSFIVDLDGLFTINSIQLYHRTGAGTMKIEVEEDCCTGFSMAGIVNMTGNTEDLNRWFTVVNSPINYRRVKRLRFTLIGSNESTGINRLYICANPVESNCSTGGGGNQPKIEVVAPLSAEAVDVDTRSATIKWTPAQKKVGEQIGSQLEFYNVRYGVSLDANGAIVSATEKQINSEGVESQLETALGSLIPATDYYVDVITIPDQVPCVTNVIPKMRVTFRTLSEETTKERANTKPNEVTEVRVFPNPTDELLNVELPKNQPFNRWVVTYPSGIQVQEGVLTENLNQSIKINTQKMPVGSYLLTLIGKQCQPVTKVFVVMR